MKRRTFLSLIFAPAISRADFTLPGVLLRERPPAIVFGADSCAPCRALKAAVARGRWSELGWTFLRHGTASYEAALARWNKRARFAVTTYPTIYFPEAGELGCVVEGYKPTVIDAVVAGTWRPVKRAEQLTGYPTDNRRWQLYPVETRTTLISHLLRSSNHRSANFSLAWLNTLSLAELGGLHSDHHDRKVRWKYVKATISRAKTRSRKG